MTPESQKMFNDDQLIARYLGWYQEEGQPDTWFKKTESSIIVAYSFYNHYPHRDLPFHRDWNALMEVINKILNADSSTEFLSEKPGLNYRCRLTCNSGGVKRYEIWGSGDTVILAAHNAVIKYLKEYLKYGSN